MKLRRVLTILLILVPMLAASAQDQSLINRFYNGLSSSCLELSYKYVVRLSGTVNNGEGCLYSQGLMWRMTGNGVEMYCDSSSVWILDQAMKEVVIEPVAEADANEWLSNPAVIFSLISRAISLLHIRALLLRATDVCLPYSILTTPTFRCISSFTITLTRLTAPTL